MYKRTGCVYVIIVIIHYFTFILQQQQEEKRRTPNARCLHTPWLAITITNHKLTIAPQQCIHHITTSSSNYMLSFPCSSDNPPFYSWLTDIITKHHPVLSSYFHVTFFSVKTGIKNDLAFKTLKKCKNDIFFLYRSCNQSTMQYEMEVSLVAKCFNYSQT